MRSMGILLLVCACGCGYLAYAMGHTVNTGSTLGVTYNLSLAHQQLCVWLLAIGLGISSSVFLAAGELLVQLRSLIEWHDERAAERATPKAGVDSKTGITLKE